MTTFLNPYTDFGFKKIFGEEASKPLLMDFLNSLLPDYHQIKTLNFRNHKKKLTEQMGANDIARRAVYDIYCESTTGEKFIVEMQKVGHKYFKDRTIYYSTFPIQEQAEKGNWNYEFSAIYCIGVVDFMLNHQDEQREVKHTIQLKNQRNQVFYDKLTFIYLEMPSFHKTESQLTTRLDKWLFFLKHLENLEDVPSIFNEAIFMNAFDKARVANLKGGDFASYQASLKAMRDNYAVWKSSVDDAREEGREEGLKKGREEGLEEGLEKGREEGEKLKQLEIAINFKKAGLTVEVIANNTGLTIDEVNAL